LKNSLFKSFRFEIVICSFLSLIYTLLTESGILLGIYIIFQVLKGKNTTVIEDTRINEFANKSISPSTYVPKSKPFLSRGAFYGLLLFIILLSIVLFITYLEKISWGITELSAGNFNNRIQIESEDEFAFIAAKLNQMAGDIKNIIANERKNEEAKNELITSVAHDLRTPLTSLIGYLELVLNKTDLTDETRIRFIEVAYHKSTHLQKLIDDLFTYTKISFGEVNLEKGELDMVKFINQLVDEFYPSFTEYELDYEFICEVNSAPVWADGNLLARAFTNLISNAIKYGKDGKRVEVELTVEDEKVIISIVNYGIIIPEKDIDHIFERFFRVESSRSSETGGSGLGLSITKDIIQMHDGTITVKSGLNGTIFQVTLKKEEKQKGD